MNRQTEIQQEPEEEVKCSVCGDLIGHGHVEPSEGIRCDPCQLKGDIQALETNVRNAQIAYEQARKALHERCALERLPIIQITDLGGKVKGSCFLFSTRSDLSQGTFSSTKGGILVSMPGGSEIPLDKRDSKAFVVQIPRAFDTTKEE